MRRRLQGLVVIATAGASAALGGGVGVAALDGAAGATLPGLRPAATSEPAPATTPTTCVAPAPAPAAEAGAAGGDVIVTFVVPAC
jgi:hypothetical protein